jgi:CheY-like chemotaxis protein
VLPPIRILVVDDYKDWRDQVRLLLRARPELQIICEVSDGQEAVQKAEELKPDLILLDIGLPRLSGIEAARQIRQVSPWLQDNLSEPGQFLRRCAGSLEHRRFGLCLQGTRSE